MALDWERRGLLPKGLSLEQVELTGDRVLVQTVFLFTPLHGAPQPPVRNAVGFHGRYTAVIGVD